jgi:hypothetical protein
MTSEAAVQQQIRLEGGRRGVPLLRNNVGASFDKTGRLIRYGLGHDSAKTNNVFKSSDLIGIWPRLVTQDMVGQVIGQFVAVECKRPGWVFCASDEHAVAQKNFGDWVARHGGLFLFATSPTDLWREP